MLSNKSMFLSKTSICHFHIIEINTSLIHLISKNKKSLIINVSNKQFQNPTKNIHATNKKNGIIYQGMKALQVLNFALMSAGYIWWLNFDRPIKEVIRSVSMQGYFIVWLYYFLAVFNIHHILTISRHALFQLGMVLQLLITSGYWLLIHPQEEYLWMINWLMYIHATPIFCHALTLVSNNMEIQNRIGLLSVYALGVGFPINYVYSQFDEQFYPPVLAYESFVGGLAKFTVTFLVLCKFSTLFWWANRTLTKRKS